jgi:hypothetical protein
MYAKSPHCGFTRQAQTRWQLSQMKSPLISTMSPKYHLITAMGWLRRIAVEILVGRLHFNRPGESMAIAQPVPADAEWSPPACRSGQSRRRYHVEHNRARMPSSPEESAHHQF